jgi:hypothetical protein
VTIPPIADPDRRARNLADPELFLRTYGQRIFYNPFASHHLAMIDAIYQRAVSGGDKAIAAPRGDGKTQIATWMIVYILLAELVSFPVIVAATRKHAQKIFKQIKHTFAWNELLAADFPEISAPVQGLDGAPQRAAKQHVDGQKTGIVWTQDEIGFPSVAPRGGTVNYAGRYLTYFGLDSAVRGVHFMGVRPDFCLIDDPETRDVAFSDDQNRKVEEMIDGDIAGLAGPDSTVSRVVLTTIQNRHSYSFRVTDRSKKPTFAGDRYGLLEQWPTNRDLWEEYISFRQQGQAKGDKDGAEAVEFYLNHREAMDEGAIITNPDRFNQRLDADGKTVEVSALQSFFNKVADWGLPRVLAELQNDPEETESEETLGLTAGVVASRISGLQQGQLPPGINDVRITAGLDVGKYWSHWVKVAWHGNAIGHIIDYGIMETPGMAAQVQAHAVQVALLKSLHHWRPGIMSSNPPEFCLIDSGDYTDAVYEFCRSVGKVFHPSKGWDAGRFRSQGTDTVTRRHFWEAYANLLKNDRIWLYNVNTEFWKQWLQERFAVPTFDNNHQYNDGALSLYASQDTKKHLTFSHHVVAEERQERFVSGKGVIRKWVQTSKNNHYLDALALACAAAGVMGTRLIPPKSLQEVPKPKKPRRPKAAPNRYRTRPGGWAKVRNKR